MENTAFAAAAALTSASSVPEIVRGAVGDAHAELDQRRIVDQPLADQLVHEDELPGVEHLQLRTHAELLHPRAMARSIPGVLTMM